jgi:OmpA-OmpF porin, OOP family
MKAMIFKGRKKNLFVVLAFIIAQTIVYSQNLIVNPSFEIPADSNRMLPPGEYDIARAKGWSKPTRAQATLYSSIPTLATGNRAMSKWKFMAKEGNNVAGITTFGALNMGNEKAELREYLQGSLIQALTVGKKYYISYWVHFHNEGTNNIGFVFTTRPLSIDSVFRLTLQPQINNTQLINYSNSNPWIQVRDSFIAREPYTHLIMGNFYANKETKVQSNQYHYHKAYIDDMTLTVANDDKMPARDFDAMVAEAIKKENTTPSVSNSISTLNTNNTDISSNTSVMKGEVLVLDKVWFDYNASNLQKSSSTQLDKLVFYLEKNPNMHILVKGHTSSEGTTEYNMKLSEARAQAVVNYIISKGISVGRLTYKGFGETQPVTTNEGEDNRQKNRRVEFEVIRN